MARAQKLKVYRTVAGFNDAYVAAPSQKAALEAWGSDRDLFARGIAELVTDPALTAEPLASPGVVVKHSRGTTAEQIKAMPDPEPQRQQAQSSDRSKASRQSVQSKPAAPSKTAPKPKPKPSRAKLEAAEAKVETVTSDYADRMKALAEQEAKFARERRGLEEQQRQDVGAADAAAEHERQAYDDAMRRWRKASGNQS